MQNTFEEIRNQIHEIRSFLGPFDLKLASLDDRILENRAMFEERFGRIETTAMASSFKIDEQAAKIRDLLERVGLIERTLKIPVPPERQNAAPVREDKAVPELLPPQKPAP